MEAARAALPASPNNRIDTVIHAAPAVLRPELQGRRHYADTKRCCAREATPKRLNRRDEMSAIAGKTCEKVGCGRRSICSLTQVRRPVLPQLFRRAWYVQRRAISRLHPAGADFLPELLPLISELRSAAFVWRNAAPEPRHRKDSPHLGADDTHEQILFQIPMAAPIGLRPACLCPCAQHLPSTARHARRRTRQPHFAS